MLSQKLQQLSSDFSSSVFKAIQQEVLSSIATMAPGVAAPAALTATVSAGTVTQPKKRGRKPKAAVAAEPAEKTRKKMVLSEEGRKARAKSLEKARAQKARNARARKKAAKAAAAVTEAKPGKKRGRKPKEATVATAATNHAKTETAPAEVATA